MPLTFSVTEANGIAARFSIAKAVAMWQIESERPDAMACARPPAGLGPSYTVRDNKQSSWPRRRFQPCGASDAQRWKTKIWLCSKSSNPGMLSSFGILEPTTAKSFVTLKHIRPSELPKTELRWLSALRRSHLSTTGHKPTSGVTSEGIVPHSGWGARVVCRSFRGSVGRNSVYEAKRYSPERRGGARPAFLFVSPSS